MNKAESFCKEYKAVTEELLAAVEKEDFDKMESLLSQRQKLIDNLSEEAISKAVLAEAFKNMNIPEMDIKLNSILEEKKTSFAASILNIEKNKKANQVYNMTALDSKQIILSKKV